MKTAIKLFFEDIRYSTSICSHKINKYIKDDIWIEKKTVIFEVVKHHSKYLRQKIKLNRFTIFIFILIIIYY